MQDDMFPAHAGMNRPSLTLAHFWGYVPRTRGDEPMVIHIFTFCFPCSPHTRGDEPIKGNPGLNKTVGVMLNAQDQENLVKSSQDTCQHYIKCQQT